MKFAMLVKNTDSPVESAWVETYTIHTKSPLDCAKDMANAFNSSLGLHGRPREVLMVRILDSRSVGQHDFERTNLVTLHENGKQYDTVRCHICGATGKRYGMHLVLDKECVAK